MNRFMTFIIIALTIAPSMLFSQDDDGGFPTPGALPRHYNYQKEDASYADDGGFTTPKGRIYAQPSIYEKLNWRIARSEKMKRDFKKIAPCPSTGQVTGACPGYVIDHINALKRGGADIPSNMQWQTVEEGKAKDKWE